MFGYTQYFHFHLWNNRQYRNERYGHGFYYAKLFYSIATRVLFLSSVFPIRPGCCVVGRGAGEGLWSDMMFGWCTLPANCNLLFFSPLPPVCLIAALLNDVLIHYILQTSVSTSINRPEGTNLNESRSFPLNHLTSSPSKCGPYQPFLFHCWIYIKMPLNVMVKPASREDWSDCYRYSFPYFRSCFGA